MSEFDDVAKTAIGRSRDPSPEELADAEVMLRPTSVLAFHDTDAELPPLERHVASLLDGKRALVAVGRNSGLSTAELHEALRLLQGRGALALVAVIEDADVIVAEDTKEDTGAVNEVIPSHVMRELEAMLDEETRAPARAKLAEPDTGFDHEETTEVRLSDEKS